MATATASQLVGPAKLRYRTAQFEVGEVVAWLHVLPEYGCYQTVRGVVVRKSATRLCLQVTTRGKTAQRWVKPTSVQPWVEPAQTQADYVASANTPAQADQDEPVSPPTPPAPALDKRHRLALAVKRLEAQHARMTAQMHQERDAVNHLGHSDHYYELMAPLWNVERAIRRVDEQIIHLRTWRDDPADITLSRWAARQSA